MKLELTIKRAGGTPVSLGNKNYEFKPEDPKDPDSAHVCEVDDDSHIATLLGTGVYKLAGKRTKPAESSAPNVPAATTTAAVAQTGEADPLAGMDDAKVREWAKANKLRVQGVGVLKGAKLREKVLAASKA
jgi:hypothetical protein